MRKIYNVAGHLFEVDANEALVAQLEQYKPFEVSVADGPIVFALKVAEEEGFPDVEVTIDTSQDDDGSQITAGHTADGRSYFEFLLYGQRAARMLVSGSDEATVWLEDHSLFGLNNGLMVMYTLATACRRTALFHSSVVSYRGRGYMFLGQSGTGKSTHSSLWLKHIAGTQLVNRSC